MKKLKYYAFVCFACIVCSFMLSGCGDKADAVVNGDTVTDSVTFELFSSQTAVINVENGKYTGGVAYSYRGSIVGTFTPVDSKSRKYSKLECVFEGGKEPFSPAKKLIITIDKRGDITEEVYCYSDGTTHLAIKYDYKYGKDGNIKKITSYQNGEKWYVEEYATAPDGKSYVAKKTVGRSVTIFNSYGHEVSSVNYSSDGTVELDDRHEYVYDDRGNPLTHIAYRDGVHSFTESFTYDENDRLLSEAAEYSGEMFLTRREAQHTYDEEGNEYYVEREFYHKGDKYVAEKVNGQYRYVVVYRSNGEKEYEMFFREDTQKTKVLKNGKTVPLTYMYHSIDYDESGKKVSERYYDPSYASYEANGSVSAHLCEEIVYADKYLRTVYEDGESFNTVRQYDENGSIVYEYKYEELYNSKGVLAYRDEYENGVLKIRTVFSAEGELMFTNLYVDGELKIQNIYKRSEHDVNTDGKIKETKTSNFTELPSLD